MRVQCWFLGLPRWLSQILIGIGALLLVAVCWVVAFIYTGYLPPDADAIPLYPNGQGLMIDNHQTFMAFGFNSVELKHIYFRVSAKPTAVSSFYQSNLRNTRWREKQSVLENGITFEWLKWNGGPLGDRSYDLYVATDQASEALTDVNISVVQWTCDTC